MKAREFKKSLQHQDVLGKSKEAFYDAIEEHLEESRIKKLRMDAAIKKFLFALIFFIFIFATWNSLANAQNLNDGIPEPDRVNTEKRLLTYSVGGSNVFDYSTFPTLIRDFGTVYFISNSPNDPSRSFNNIPSFSLARWHWWLFGFDVLPRAQRQFAEVIAEIKAYQRLLGEAVMIDDPQSPFYDNIISVREYLVPFEPVQNMTSPELMPDKQTQIDHLIAALASINTTVYFKGLYEGIARDYRQKALGAIETRYFEKIKAQYKLTPIKKRK